MFLAENIPFLANVWLSEQTADIENNCGMLIILVFVQKVLCHYKMLFIDYADTVSEARATSDFRTRMNFMPNHILHDCL